MTATALKLRSPHFASVDVVAPTGGYTAGEMVKVQELVGLIVLDADATKTVVLIYGCEKVVVPKTVGTGITFSVGDKVYYDAAAKEVTNVASGNTLCGRALEDAALDDDEVEIDLKGNVAA